MSGPWDRPPSPDDGDWPSEDIETRSSADRPVEPWSADDPWQERRDASPGWDEWPQPAPSSDDYVTEEPEPPASDPWAESWSEDEPGIPASPEPDYGPPPTEPFAESAVESAAEPASEPVAEAAAEPVAEPEPAVDAPRTQPWSPDPDPWGAASVDAWSPSYADAAVPTAAAVDEEEPAEKEPEHAAPASESQPEWREPEPEPASVAPEPELEPTLVAPEPGPAFEQAELESEPEAEPGPEAEIPPFLTVPEPEPEPESQPVFVESEPEPAPEPELPPFLAVPEPEPEPEPAFEPPSWMPVETPPELRPTALVEPALEPALAEPAPVAAPLVEPDMNGVEDGAGAASPWEADPWTIPIEPAAYEPIPETEPEIEPQPESQPAPDAGSAAAQWPTWDPDIETETLPEPEPEPEPERTVEPESWPESGDSTQVLPTSWSPHTPREATGELEPRTGEVRTTLAAESESEAEDEEADASTAEQAVPWLIGVILLLAGMVIVLIALIFAGDASLGALGADPSDSPQASPINELLPTPVATGTPNATPSGSPGESAAPSPTSATEPQYGPLEMIYQGRAAALAPIYLLLRDFTAEDEPLVLAQDPNLDVRRFAWAPDGTVGAGLYSDLLVSIETGVQKRPLGDGMSAITFGDDGSTVYAVRITADGGNDVATLLSIDFASGDSSELASVTYARPQVAEEAALAEAQFGDDGGTVRLYWLKNNTLGLWVLGGGMWSIEPSDREVTEIEGGEVPLLWSPDGRRRVGLAVNGGTTTLRLVDRSGEELASGDVNGRVSHLRWSPDGKRVVFTVGRSGSGGGVLQDLYLWDLGVGENPDPMRITDTGAAFGAEWRGSQALWEAR